MTTLERTDQLFQLADGQAGYFTAQQALALGYGYPAQHYHLERGTWQRAGHGLYRLRRYPLGEHEQLAALTLWSRDRAGTPQAVVSHHTALGLHGLGDLLPEHLHLSVPPTFRKPPPPGVVLHRATWTETDLQTRHGFMLTEVGRTLNDLIGWLPAAVLEAAVVEAGATGLLSGAAVARLLDRLGASAAPA
jgi:predicted transcriptional regulator of viral defense system